MVQGFVNYVSTGCIIEFMQEKSPQIAWVLEENTNKLRLLLPNRKETTIQSTRVLPWLGPSYGEIKTKDAAINILEQHQKKRKELQENYNPVELWEFAQGEVHQASAQWFCELTTNAPDIDTIAACAHSLLTYNTHFKFQPPNFEVYSKEVVETRLKEKELAKSRALLIQHGKAFIHYLWDVHLHKKTFDAVSINIDMSFTEQLQQYIFEQIVHPECSDNTVWKELTRGLPDDPFLPFYLAQAWGIIQPHHNYLLDRASCDAGTDWSIPYQETINAICHQPYSSTVSSSIPFISIDAVTTKDIDDAFFIKQKDNGWELTVALACPALHWPFEEPLDLAVRHRATSMYVPEATYNMLPEELGTNIYSLHEQIIKPVLLVSCFINSNGTVENCNVSFDYISLSSNLTYIDCEDVLNNKTSPASPYAEQLYLALQLAEIYQSYRLKQGAIIVDRIEPNISLYTDNEEIQVRLEEEPPSVKSHVLVSELMILTNAALANWAYKQAIPLFHRTQDITIPAQFVGIWKEPHEIAKAVKILTPSLLEVLPKPHAGLGEKRYAPLTSPLRRYPDLINQGQLLHVLQYGTIKWSHQELEAMLPYINSRLEIVIQAQRFRQRYWKLVYFLQQGEDVWWPAIITEINDHYVTINLPKEQMNIRTRRAFFTKAMNIGYPIHVRIGKVRPLHNEIQVIEIQET